MATILQVARLSELMGYVIDHQQRDFFQKATCRLAARLIRATWITWKYTIKLIVKLKDMDLPVVLRT